MRVELAMGTRGGPAGGDWPETYPPLGRIPVGGGFWADPH